MLRISINRIITNPQQSLCLQASFASRLKPSTKLPNNNQISANSIKFYHTNILTSKQTNANILFNNSRAILNLSTLSSNNVEFNKNQKFSMSTATNENLSSQQKDSEVPLELTDNQVKTKLIGLERTFTRFEEKCQRAERVPEKDFVKTFDTLTRTYEQIELMKKLTPDIKVNLSLLSAILIRCCGKLMVETEPQTRELLAGNLWHFIKEKQIPLDISHYNSLIRVLNENQTNFDPKKILDEINQNNLTPDRITYQRLIHQYCLQGDITNATSLLEKMKDLTMELNELTFASLIIGYNKQDTPPTMKEMFDLMRSNDVEPGSKSYAAAIISLAQSMSKNPSAGDELKTVFETIKKDEIQFSIYDAVDILTSLASMKENEIATKIVEYVCQTPTYNFNSRYRLYSTLFKIGEYEKVSKLYWAQEPSENARKNSNIGVFYIRILAKHKNLPIEFVIKECSQLLSKGYNKKAFYHLYYCAAEDGNLPVVRAALKKIAEEEPIKCQYLWPLIAQAKDEEEIVYALKNDFNPQMDNNDLMDTFSQWIWPRFADKIDSLFELNKQQLNYDNNLLMASFLNYSVQENKVLDAIKFISEAPQELVDVANQESAAEEEPDNMDSMVSTTGRQRIRSDRGSLVGKLLNQIAEHTRDPAMVNKAFSLCKLPGQQISNRNSSALVKVHILNDDYKSALEVFLKLAREQQATPCKGDLMTYCLEKKDPESLQKIMDVSTEIYGETNSLFDLAVCCLQCGKLKQAQKIFASPGFRVNPLRVYNAGRQLANQGNINVLENFVHFTREMYDVHQETLYQILIDAYERTSNGKRVLDLWNRMQEEEFQPSKRSLVMIANVLERNGMEVPFQKPKMDLRGGGVGFGGGGFGDRRNNYN